MSLFRRVIDEAKENYRRIILGEDINIPFPFPNFSKRVTGIRQGRYYLMSANQKVGKSQITDYMFMYHPYFYLKKRKSNIKLKIFYISLEMRKEEKIRQALCHFMFVKSNGKIRVDPEELDSQKGVVKQEILKYAESLEEEFAEFEKTVEFVDFIANPFGIYNYVREYFRKNGKFYFNGVEVIIPENPKWEDYKWNKYVANNPDEYVEVILDHYGLLKPEKGGSSFDAIGDMSKYFVKLRNNFNCICVPIQQQNLDQESVTNIKMDKLRPSANGLNLNRHTGQDCDTMFGLFSPFRHDIQNYKGYVLMTDDFTQGLRDNHRELSVVFSRRGTAANVQLYFDGKTNYFEELPPKNSAELVQLYEKLKERRKN